MRLRLVATVVVLIAALAGCGGTKLDFDPGPPLAGGGSASNDDAAAAAAAFARAANGVCSKVSDRFSEAQRETPRSFEQAAQVMDALVKIASQGEEALAQLSPPPQTAAVFERYLAGRMEALKLLQAARAAARSEDADAYEEARTKLNDGSADRQALAQQAGLSSCAAAEGA